MGRSQNNAIQAYYKYGRDKTDATIQKTHSQTPLMVSTLYSVLGGPPQLRQSNQVPASAGQDTTL